MKIEKDEILAHWRVSLLKVAIVLLQQEFFFLIFFSFFFFCPFGFNSVCPVLCQTSMGAKAKVGMR